MKPRSVSVAHGKTLQRVIAVGVQTSRTGRREMERSLGELERLIETAGGEVVEMSAQTVHRVSPATFLGDGKVEELAGKVEELQADIVAVDAELSPVQNKNLEKRLGCLVLDRTACILDIFAMRARSNEGKIQVELAQLKYLAPRLVGRGQTFSQQTGRIGTRGPGETKLEYDRRRVRDRMALLRGRLEGVRRHRRIHRAKRESVPIPLISLVGYTNTGKSTLMNTLTNAGVFVEDKLFATLDPTVRRLKLPSGREVLIADTVGFIKRLPHELVESFKSTFEEAAHADLLLHVIDGSDPEAHVQAETVENVLADMELEKKLRINIVNKCDIAETHYIGDGSELHISALREEGLGALLAKIDELLKREYKRVELLLPHDRGDILANIYRVGHVSKAVHKPNGVHVTCELHAKHAGKYREYIT